MQPLSIKIPFPVTGSRSKLALCDCGCTFCSKVCVVVCGGGVSESMDLLLFLLCSSLIIQPLTVDLESVQSLKPRLPYILVNVHI